MPRHVVELAAAALDDRRPALKGPRIGLLGVAFKPDVRDARNAPAAEVIAGLISRGATTEYHDPHVPRFVAGDGTALESVPLDALLEGSELIVIVTPHKAIDWDAVYQRAELILDTTNSSRGRSVGERQVLRLGAGWGSAPARA